MVTRMRIFYSILATAALAAAGVVGYALFSRASQSPEHVVRLAKPDAAVLTPQAYLNALRELKAMLVKSPTLKHAGLFADFSWKRDVFDSLLGLFHTVLLQNPDEQIITKILSLADAIADEFEQEVAGDFYHAEAHAAAAAWADAMYQSLEKQSGMPATIGSQRSKQVALPAPSKRLKRKAALKKVHVLEQPASAPVTAECLPGSVPFSSHDDPTHDDFYLYDPITIPDQADAYAPNGVASQPHADGSTPTGAPAKQVGVTGLVPRKQVHSPLQRQAADSKVILDGAAGEVPLDFTVPQADLSGNKTRVQQEIAGIQEFMRRFKPFAEQAQRQTLHNCRVLLAR
ncbi:hypothetical protein EBZ39_08095 [bacterium]|nr:hypothetical protein [bacterium]